MPTFHLTPAGEPGVCRAQKTCPYGDLVGDHYSSESAARAAFEASMRSETFGGQSAPSTLTTADLLAMDEDAQRRTAGAVWRVLQEGLPETNEAAAYWQAAYDSSAAGALWLERKRLEHPEHSNPAYQRRKAKLDAFLAEQATNPMQLELPEDPGDVFNHEFSTAEPLLLPSKSSMGQERTKLALASAAWMSALTPEETEAVSWVTSNGASVLNLHVNGEEHPIWGHHVYSERHLNRTLRNFRSAMAKAPVLDQPAIVYRGTNIERAQWTELSRPASGSLSAAVTLSYRGSNDDGTYSDAEPVMLEVKTRKLPSAVGMSAWGTGEMEVLLPLGRYEKVGDFHALRGRRSKRRGGASTIDPELDRIRVIQLEYLG